MITNEYNGVSYLFIIQFLLREKNQKVKYDMHSTDQGAYIAACSLRLVRFRQQGFFFTWKTPARYHGPVQLNIRLEQMFSRPRVVHRALYILVIEIHLRLVSYQIRVLQSCQIYHHPFWVIQYPRLPETVPWMPQADVFIFVSENLERFMEAGEEDVEGQFVIPPHPIAAVATTELDFQLPHLAKVPHLAVRDHVLQYPLRVVGIQEDAVHRVVGIFYRATRC